MEGGQPPGSGSSRSHLAPRRTANQDHDQFTEHLNELLGQFDYAMQVISDCKAQIAARGGFIRPVVTLTMEEFLQRREAAAARINEIEEPEAVGEDEDDGNHQASSVAPAAAQLTSFTLEASSEEYDSAAAASIHGLTDLSEFEDTSLLNSSAEATRNLSGAGSGFPLRLDESSGQIDQDQESSSESEPEDFLERLRMFRDAQQNGDERRRIKMLRYGDGNTPPDQECDSDDALRPRIENGISNEGETVPEVNTAPVENIGSNGSLPARDSRSNAQYQTDSGVRVADQWRDDSNFMPNTCNSRERFTEYFLPSDRVDMYYRDTSWINANRSTSLNKRECWIITSLSTDLIQTPPLVLQKVFGFLDKQTLGLCRRVCKSWNQAALPVYAQKNWTEFGFYNDRQYGTDQLQRVLGSWEDTMLDATPGLIGKLRVQFRFLRLKSFDTWFHRFGCFLTSLFVSGPFSRHTLFKALKVCRNLTKLGVCDLAPHPDDMNTSIYRPTQPIFPCDLRLKELEIIGGLTLNWLENEENVLFMATIVLASPDLETMITDFDDQFGSFWTFVNEIRRERVTMNLVKWIVGQHRESPSASLLCHIPPIDAIFSDKLKFLHFRNILDGKTHIWNGDESWSEVTYLENILTRVKGSLDTLILSGSYSSTVPPSPNTFGYNIGYPVNLPIMKCLKVFENLSMDQFQLFSFGFMTHLPNLETLVLSAESVHFFRAIFYHPENIIVAENPHTNLKKLTLSQSLSFPSEIMLLAKMFPNLSKLGFSLGMGLINGNGGQHLFLQSSLQALRQLPRLECLGLELRGLYDPVKIHDQLKDVFESLQSLKSFALVSNVGLETRKRLPHLKQIIMKSTILKRMCEAKKLRRLTLVNFVIPLVDAIDLKATLDSKNVGLIVAEDDCYYVGSW